MGGAGALAAGLAAWAAWFEPRRTVVRHVPLALPRWPRRFDGFRVALVSDLHTGGPHVGLDRVERVARIVQGLGPDVVALLGDYVDPEVALGEAVAPEAVAARLGAVRAPLGTVAVLGNHDWLTDGRRIAAALRDHGVRVLENGAVRLRSGAADGALWIAGVADATTRGTDVDAALADVPAGATVVLLSHDPDVFPRVPERVALTLSGHTHGGQVAIPLARRRWIPSRFGDRYAGGTVSENGRRLFISRGVGNSRLPLRVGAPPEVVLLELSSAR